LVDNSVLSGPRLAVKDLQRVLGVPVDGIIGPQTCAAYGRLDTRVVGNRLAIGRALRLARHVKKHPDQLVFLVGWLSRCHSFIE
jgi:lysozyme family protein